MVLTFTVISFRARRRWHSADAVAETYPKSLENDANIHPNSSQIHRKSSKIDQNGGQEHPEGELGSTLVGDPFSGTEAEQKLSLFWRHLGDFGRHLGPRGCQNQEFWCQDAIKS